MLKILRKILHIRRTLGEAIISMKELDEWKAIKELFGELEQGEESAGEKGYISLTESRRMLGV